MILEILGDIREEQNCALFELNAPFMRIRLDIVKSYGRCEEDIAKIYMRNGVVLGAVHL